MMALINHTACILNSAAVWKTVQRSAVIVTAVRVTISYSGFLLPKKDLLILKIFGYCDSRF